MFSHKDLNMTSLLRFHSFESVLVACDGHDGISIWDITCSNMVKYFKNGNAEKSRMTSLSWINETSNTLLLTGCDNGSVRIWDSLFTEDDTVCSNSPLLCSAFRAVPELVTGQRGSGLITEWQQSRGRLLAGGNTKFIQCWDLESETCTNVLEHDVDNCVTTLTTAWDHVMGESRNNSISQGFSVIGPDIFVAGYGNGTLKVFEVRLQSQNVMSNSGSQRQTSSNFGQKKSLLYNEHSHWIVNTSFSYYGSRFEERSYHL